MTRAKRLLVTRPEGQEGPLCQLLQRAGYDTAHQALLRVEPVAELSPAQRQLIIDLDLYHHVIFISSNAIRCAMQWIESLWPQIPVTPGFYAMGASSAALLRERGLWPLLPESGADSEGLLARPELQTISGQRVLLVRGAGGRTLLRDTLQQRGARVDELECYQRSCPPLAAGHMACLLADCDMVLLSSGEGLGNMLSLLSPAETTKFSNMPLVVPSRRVAEMAAAAGFTRVITAASAADQAMLAAVEAYWRSAGE